MIADVANLAVIISDWAHAGKEVVSTITSMIGLWLLLRGSRAGQQPPKEEPPSPPKPKAPKGTSHRKGNGKRRATGKKPRR